MKKTIITTAILLSGLLCKAQSPAPQPAADTLVTIRIKVSDLSVLQGILKHTYENADNNAVSSAYEMKQVKSQIARLFPILQPATEPKKPEVKPQQQPKKKS